MSDRTRTPSPHNTFNTKPPPIPIPHLLLDRSRLKPVPKQVLPKPQPIQSPFPLRSRLKSTTGSKPPTLTHSATPGTTTPPTKVTVPTTPTYSTTPTNSTATPTKSPTTPTKSPTTPTKSSSTTTTKSSTPTTPTKSPSETTPSLPSIPAESPKDPLTSNHPQPMSNDNTFENNHLDQIQPWQHQLTPSSLDHSNLERANSAAARLDSLARLNGLRIPNLPESRLNSSADNEDDSLPPFLMAKHFEEIQKKAGLMSPPLPIPQYPLPLPSSLGFGVGPNGRGVPRLSALQRKALEKMAATQQDSQDLSTATTSLTRSHTTTGTESRKLLTNRILSSSANEGHERQQARSNLIRKLSSRDPNSRSKFPALSPPTPANPPQIVGEHLNQPSRIPIDPECLLTSSSIEPTLTSPHQEPVLSKQPQEDAQTHHHILNPMDLNQALDQIPSVSDLPLDSLPDHISQSHTPMDDPTRSTSTSSPVLTDDPPHVAQRYSLNSLDSQTDPNHTTLAPPNHVKTSSASHSDVINTQLHSGVEFTPDQSFPPPSIPSQSYPVHESSWLDFSQVNSNRPSVINCPPDSVAEQTSRANLAPNPEPGALTTSSRSSIVSRLKARASLSSRIERSIATGRPPSPSQNLSRQSSLDHGNEGSSERRRSAINGNFRASRPPSNSPTLPRIRPTTNEASQDRSRHSHGTFSRVGSPIPSNRIANCDKPPRPTRAPPIGLTHSVTSSRAAAIPNKSSPDLGPSQFPPTPHLVRTHMPVASAVDLARYNDQKLAPFPALLNSSPPGSPERARSPPRVAVKSSKSSGHGILSSASNFFRSPSRNQDEDLTHTARGKNQMTASPHTAGHLARTSCSSEEQEEVVNSSRWQSIGDAAGKMSASAEVSRSPTVDSNSSSAISMISNQRREQILSRLSPFLRPSHSSTGSQDHKLNDPPRKLLWHQPVLQVVNATSVKDRYLFLFNDLLVITKPIMQYEESKGERVPKLPITLKHLFLTKSVVEIKNLRCVCTDQARRHASSPQGRQQVQLANGDMGTPEQWFHQTFSQDPTRAIQTHLQNTGLEQTECEIAKLLVSASPSLDKRQLGQFLTAPDRHEILRYYLEQFNLAYMRIEDGLRSVLLSLRLPADPPAIERFLTEFGVVWTTSNPKVGLTAALVTRWATGMTVLSEHLHDGLTDSMRYVAGFIGFPNGIKTEAGFLEMMTQAEEKLVANGKPASSLPAEKLETMLKKSFQSIRRDRLVQARANAEDTEKIEIVVEEEGGHQASKLPSHIIYHTPSDLITIKIAQPDSQFGIKLFGSGMSFEPSFLSFSQSASASFRITGKALGVRQISFIKVGRRAAAYEGLPLGVNVSVERAFMKQTVQVGFLNHMMAKRKYLFSFLSGEAKADFLELVQEAQTAARYKQVQHETQSGPQAVARSVALQVLIDTLIVNEDLIPMNVNPHASTTVGLKMSGNSKPRKASAGATKEDEPKFGPSPSGKIRSNSLSETYIHTLGRSEIELHQAIIDRRNQAQELHVRRRQQKLLQEQLRSNLAGGKLALNPYSSSNKENPVGVADEKENEVVLAKFLKSGNELVKHCEQNSLVPLVLGFLSMGVDREPQPLGPSSHLHSNPNPQYHFHHAQNSHHLPN